MIHRIARHVVEQNPGDAGHDPFQHGILRLFPTRGNRLDRLGYIRDMMVTGGAKPEHQRAFLLTVTGLAGFTPLARLTLAGLALADGQRK